MEIPASPQDLLAFWRDAGPERWFSKNDELDELCRRLFLPVYKRAADGELADWEQTAEGALALIILLDQLPRNMFRGDPQAWATDSDALHVAERAIVRDFDCEVDAVLRRFFYIPFMYAEDIAAQKHSLRLHETLGDSVTLEWAKHYHDIVLRFGRFRHQNVALGRASTLEEIAFLKDNDFRG